MDDLEVVELAAWVNLLVHAHIMQREALRVTWDLELLQAGDGPLWVLRPACGAIQTQYGQSVLMTPCIIQSSRWSGLGLCGWDTAGRGGPLRVLRPVGSTQHNTPISMAALESMSCVDGILQAGDGPLSILRPAFRAVHNTVHK